VLASDRTPGRNSHADGVGSVDESGSRVTLDDCELHRASPHVSILLFRRVESNVGEALDDYDREAAFPAAE